MARVMAFYRSLVGQKLIMAVTGIMLYLFLIEHAFGNLLIFFGPESLNRYGAFLRSPDILPLIWAARVGLIIALILHLIAAVWVTLANWRARPVSYLSRRDIETNYAARTMIISGPLILAYVVYHLLMFTFLTTGPGYSETDIYRNVVLAFQVPLISGVYILAMLILGFHLWHAGWSMLQSLGVTWPSRRGLRWGLLPAVGVLIAAGFVLVPVGVLTGIIR
jgi:succinate dehydrogenase / fumarate reductase cytochrome b subunit